MIVDMRMCKLSPKIQGSYIRAMRQFAKYHGRALVTATVVDLRGRLQRVGTATKIHCRAALSTALLFRPPA